MPVTKDRPAPYAPTSAIMSVVERNRAGKLPAIIDAEVLERSGVSASLIPRTLQALHSLDLIEEDGRKTETLEAIRLAPENEYKARLAEWLNKAYADALIYIDPDTATDTDVRDAFRHYQPHGQQDRMVSLFMGLFSAAGVMAERPRQAAPRKPSGNGAPKPRAAAKPAGQTTRQRDDAGGRGSGGGFTPPPGMPPAIAGLIQSLPASGEGWTKEERDKFVTTFGAVLDFVYPIVAKKAEPDDIDELIG